MSQITPVKFTAARVEPEFNVALVRFALVSIALVRFAPYSVVLVRFELVRSVLLRFSMARFFFDPSGYQAGYHP